LRYFKNCRKSLDLGCGRGEFLGLLKASGIPAVGVDSDPDAITICCNAGLEVIKDDVFSFLQSNSGYDGIMASQLIEHLDSSRAEWLVEQCFETLPPGGILIVVTPNPENLTAFTRTFWLDPTHIRPYPLELLIGLFEGAGFEIQAAGDAAITRPGGIRATFGRIFWGPFMRLAGLRDLHYHLYSGHDIFIVGRKPGNRDENRR
jgi:SAM-dependent methyltransferase